MAETLPSLHRPRLLSFRHGITLAPGPYAALLPHRLQWMYLHCGDLLTCVTCRERVARFLADELELDLQDAVNRPAAWYREQIGERRCSMEQAAELRRLVCLEGAKFKTAQMVPDWRILLGHGRNDYILADDDGYERWQEQADDDPAPALEKKASWARWNAWFALRWLAGMVGLMLIVAGL